MQETNQVIIKNEMDGTLYVVESIPDKIAVPVLQRKIKRLILQSVKNICNLKIN